jgi:glutamate synthase domain-containing protein 3
LYKPQFEDLKKQLDQVRVYIRDQVDDMIKRDETVTLEMTSLVKSLEKQLQDKIAVSLRATNDAQSKNQEQFTALQKVIDKMRATQQDKASEVDNVHRKMRQLQ